MTKEERKERRVVSYPAPYLRKKMDEHSIKKGKNGKPQSDSMTIIDALNFFFKNKEKLLEQ